MYRTILAATDGSFPAERAVAHAVELAVRLGLPLAVVTVVPDIEIAAPVGPAGSAVLTDTHRAHEGKAERALHAAEALAADHGVRVTTHVEHGDPAERIAATAEAVGADLVVVGRRGLGAASHYVLGSVAESLLLRAAHQHVLVVRTLD